MKKTIRTIFLGTLCSMLGACSGFFDKDNTPNPSPLVNFSPETSVATRYYVKAGNGVGKDYLKLGPAITSDAIFTADKYGKVTALHKMTGQKRWQTDLHAPVSAGPAAEDNLVIVATRDGDVIALNANNGSVRFKTKASSEILARPTIQDNIVLIKAIDGKLSAFSGNDGRLLWAYQQIEPSLILRGASSPEARDHILVAGFANGNLAKLTLEGGSLQWQNTIAHPTGSFAIERMIDIDADPIISEDRVFAATYQGHIVSLDLLTGRESWTHEISSYTGMTADHEKIYISDAKSAIWAFDRQNGAVHWRQLKLAARNITAPVSIGKYIAVGDGEGYLHFLNKEDGNFVARVHVNSSPILATPVVNNGVLYVVTADGHLAAYSLV